MAPVLLPSGLHVGLPKWVDESSDPYIARLKEESYLPGVGYILELSLIHISEPTRPY